MELLDVPVDPACAEEKEEDCHCDCDYHQEVLVVMCADEGQLLAWVTVTVYAAEG